MLCLCNLAGLAAASPTLLCIVAYIQALLKCSGIVNWGEAGGSGGETDLHVLIANLGLASIFIHFEIDALEHHSYHSFIFKMDEGQQT